MADSARQDAAAGLPQRRADGRRSDRGPCSTRSRAWSARSWPRISGTCRRLESAHRCHELEPHGQGGFRANNLTSSGARVGSCPVALSSRHRCAPAARHRSVRGDQQSSASAVATWRRSNLNTPTVGRAGMRAVSQRKPTLT